MTYPVYQPREDSYLMQKVIKEYADGRVLDMGTGTGILAKEAAKTAISVIAADINHVSIEFCRKNIKDKKIEFIVSDLFEDISTKFDLIIFNPPYLPKDDNIEDIALYGGKKGYELIMRFLNDAGKYIEKDGKIILLFSSLTNKEKIGEIIKKNNFTYKEISQEKQFFEVLYIYLIEK